MEEISSKKSALVRKFANVLRTFGVGVAEVQLLDLSSPRHGRQHLEGVLAVDLAVANVELQQSPKHLEVLKLACMRQRGREVEKRVGSALSVTPKNGKFHRKSGLVRNPTGNVPKNNLPLNLHFCKFNLINFWHASSTLMSPVIA